MRPAALHSRIQQLTRRVDLAAFECSDAVVQQLLGLPLLLSQRASGALDVRACPRVLAIQKQRARPDVDRLSVVGCEVMIEAAQKQALDLGVALGSAVDRRPCCVRVIGFVRSGSDISATGVVRRDREAIMGQDDL